MWRDGPLLTKEGLYIGYRCSKPHWPLEYINWRVTKTAKSEILAKTSNCKQKASLILMSRHILDHALRTPAFQKLKDKRIVLASNSPRRKEILCTFVRHDVALTLLINLNSLLAKLGCSPRCYTIDFRRGSWLLPISEPSWVSRLNGHP